MFLAYSFAISTIDFVFSLFNNLFLNGRYKWCTTQGLSSLHSSWPRKQDSNFWIPSIASIMLNNVLWLFSGVKKKPPCGPFIEEIISFLVNSCNVFAKKGAGICSSSAICFEPIFLFLLL